jgi:hypothetical protein
LTRDRDDTAARLFSGHEIDGRHALDAMSTSFWPPPILTEIGALIASSSLPLGAAIIQCNQVLVIQAASIAWFHPLKWSERGDSA